MRTYKIFIELNPCFSFTTDLSEEFEAGKSILREHLHKCDGIKYDDLLKEIHSMLNGVEYKLDSHEIKWNTSKNGEKEATISKYVGFITIADKI